MDDANSAAMLKLTWGGIAWRGGVVLGFPLVVTIADYMGWLRVDSGSSLYPLTLVAILAVLAIDAAQRRSPALIYYTLPLVFIIPPYFRTEASRVEETARWRIVLMESCGQAELNSELAESCNAARVRADFEPCNFGRTASQCRVELYRDARWPLPQVEIAPHEYGDTLPTR